ncbi:MAG: hypothetical protein ACR2MN_12125 [Acidimicrobiales bacterium]
MATTVGLLTLWLATRAHRLRLASVGRRSMGWRAVGWRAVGRRCVARPGR